MPEAELPKPPSVICPEADKDCPPADAAQATGEVFRGVYNDPPNASDIQTTREEKKFRNRDKCQRCGISVFLSEKALRHAQDLFGKTLGRWVGRATLSAAHGFLKETASKAPGHHTWWPVDGLARESLFKVVAELSSPDEEDSE